MVAFSILSGCANSPQPESGEIPNWLSAVPQDDDYFYAVGISGRTRHVKDGWNQAAQRGRAEIGKTIITHITSTDTSISTENSEYTRQVIEAISDTELQFTEVIERWYDRYGDYGPANHYYVLVRMDKKRAEKILRSIK
jgi:hypothetical protein